MWFAGEAVRYYYRGQLMTAALATLTGNRVLVRPQSLDGGLLRRPRGRRLRRRRCSGREHRPSQTSVWTSRGLPRRVRGPLVTDVGFAFGRLPEDVALRYGEPVFEVIRHRGYEEAVLTQSTTDGWHWFLEHYVIEGALTKFPMYSIVKGDHHGYTVTTGVPGHRRRRGLRLLPDPCRGTPPKGRAAVRRDFGLRDLMGLMNAWILSSVVGLTLLAPVFAPAHPATLLGGPPYFDGRQLLDEVALQGEGGSEVTFDERPCPDRVADELWRMATATGLAAAVGALAVALGAPFLVLGTPANHGSCSSRRGRRLRDRPLGRQPRPRTHDGARPRAGMAPRPARWDTTLKVAVQAGTLCALAGAV